MAKRKTQPKRRVAKSIREHEQEKLDEIHELMHQGNHARAVQEITRFTRKSSNVVEGWELQFAICDHLDYDFRAWQASTNLVKLDDSAESYLYNLILVCLKQSMFYNARSHIADYNERFVYGGFRNAIGEMSEYVEENITRKETEDPILKTVDLDTLVLRERGQVYISNNENLAEGRKFIRNAAKKYPEWVTPHLSLIRAYTVEGKLDKALDYAHETAETYPDDMCMHGLSICN